MKTPSQEDKHDLETIEQMTPFALSDLTGIRFARGGMLGGANPLESSVTAPWEREGQSSCSKNEQHE